MYRGFLSDNVAIKIESNSSSNLDLFIFDISGNIGGAYDIDAMRLLSFMNMFYKITSEEIEDFIYLDFLDYPESRSIGSLSKPGLGDDLKVGIGDFEFEVLNEELKETGELVKQLIDYLKCQLESFKEV